MTDDLLRIIDNLETANIALRAEITRLETKVRYLSDNAASWEYAATRGYVPPVVCDKCKQFVCMCGVK